MTGKLNSTSYYKLIIGALIISFSPVFVKIIELGSISTAFYRVFLGGLALLIYSLFKRDKLFPGVKIIWISLIAGVFFAFDLAFWHVSIKFIGPGLATILGNFQVFILGLIGILFFKEKFSWQFLLAIPLAMLGIILLCGINWNQFSVNYRIGIICGLITAICYSMYILFLRYTQKIRGEISGPVIVMWINFSTALILLILGIIRKDSFIITSINELSLLLIYGIICQAVAWLLISTALPSVPASRAGLILLIQPSFSLIWDVIIFNKSLNLIELSGAIITFIAIYLGALKKNSTKRKAEVIET